MAVIGTRAFSSGDASRKNSKAELQEGMDLQWVAGEIKMRRDWTGPQFLFSFAQGIKFSPAFGAGGILSDCRHRVGFLAGRLPQLLDLAVPLEASPVAAVVAPAATAEPDYAIQESAWEYLWQALT